MMSVKRALGLLVVALICSACGNTIWVSDNFMAAKGPPDRGEYHPLSLDRTPRWSPDGRYLVVNINDFVRSIDDVAGPFTPNPDVSNPHLYSVSVADSSFRRVFIEAEGVQSGAQMAGDGRVFFVEYAYKPRVGPVRKDSSPHYRNIGIAAPDGTLQSQIPLPSESPRNVLIDHPAWLPETDRIIAHVSYHSVPGEIGIHEVDTPGGLRRLDGIEGPFPWTQGFDVSPRDDRIAYYQGRFNEEGQWIRAQVTISDADDDSDTVWTSFLTYETASSRVAWSFDGGRVFFATWEGTCPNIENTRIWSLDADGSGIALIAEIAPAHRVRVVKPSPDGSQFALVTDGCRGRDLFKIWSDGELSDLLPPCCNSVVDATPAGIAWSPDGGRIAVLDDDLIYGDILRTVNPDGSDIRTLVHRKVGGALASGKGQPYPNQN